jgi:hypothetical protein
VKTGGGGSGRAFTGMSAADAAEAKPNKEPESKATAI